MKQADVSKQLSASGTLEIWPSCHRTGESLQSLAGRGRETALSRVAQMSWRKLGELPGTTQHNHTSFPQHRDHHLGSDTLPQAPSHWPRYLLSGGQSLGRLRVSPEILQHLAGMFHLLISSSDGMPSDVTGMWSRTYKGGSSMQLSPSRLLIIRPGTRLLSITASPLVVHTLSGELFCGVIFIFCNRCLEMNEWVLPLSKKSVSHHSLLV